MNPHIELEPAVVLHHYPYRNTSLIVIFFTLNHGIISSVARSARGPKSRYKGMLQTFTPMLISWRGRHELKTLTAVETKQLPYPLNNKTLFCGFYLNELLLRLLQREDAHPPLFQLYQQTLQQLSEKNHCEITLRRFEKKLLDQLGYGLPLKQDAQTNRIISAEHDYEYQVDLGFSGSNPQTQRQHLFSGQSLIDIRNEHFEDSKVLQDCKRLMRITLNYYLGQKPLKSRELMQ